MTRESSAGLRFVFVVTLALSSDTLLAGPPLLSNVSSVPCPARFCTNQQFCGEEKRCEYEVASLAACPVTCSGAQVRQDCEPDRAIHCPGNPVCNGGAPLTCETCASPWVVDPGTGCYEPTTSGAEVKVSLDRPNFFTQVPPQWEGLPFIRSDLFPIGNPNDVGCVIGDGSLKDYRLTFTLSASAYVYVAWNPCALGENETDVGPPDWLSETAGNTYRKMPDQLLFMPRGKPCSGDILYLETAWDVYRTRVPIPAGEFTTEGYCSAAHYIVFAEEATALPPETDCGDTVDNDDDGLTDCDDSDCAALPSCQIQMAQLPGDCNQDGSFDLSDVIHFLGFLFQGNPEDLPCGTQAANLALMDCNQDGGLDLSDAVYKLAFLFQGGPGPVQGAICIDIEDCPQNQGCP